MTKTQAKTYRLAAEKFRSGSIKWMKNGSYYGDSTYPWGACLVGCISYLRHGQALAACFEPADGALVAEVIREQYPSIEGCTSFEIIAHWNDSDDTTIESVIAVLEKAAVKAEELGV